MADKTCTKCGETKPIGEFYKQPKCKGGYSTRCKACASEYARGYRRANDPIKRKEYHRKLHARIRLQAIRKMGDRCQRCEFWPTTLLEYGVLQFHHRAGNPTDEKTLQIASNILDGQTDDYMLLCANCHIIRNHLDGTAKIGMTFLPEEEVFPE